MIHGEQERHSQLEPAEKEYSSREKQQSHELQQGSTRNLPNASVI